MGSEFTYFFKIQLLKGNYIPTILHNNVPIFIHNLIFNFNEWFFSIIGLIMLNRENNKVTLVIDRNLFILLEGNENWLFITKIHCGIDIKSISLSNGFNQLSQRFYQLLLYKLLNMTGNKDFDNIIQPVKNLSIDVLEFYYQKLSSGKIVEYQFQNECKIAEAISNSRLHDGLYNKARNTTLLRAGSIIDLHKEPEKYLNFGLLYFFNFICSYNKKGKLNQLLHYCNENKRIEPDDQHEIGLFKKYLKSMP